MANNVDPDAEINTCRDHLQTADDFCRRHFQMIFVADEKFSHPSDHTQTIIARPTGVHYTHCVNQSVRPSVSEFALITI